MLGKLVGPRLALGHALLPGSPAIDRGQSNLATDQRGGVRRVDLSSVPNGPGDGSDIGAVEMGSHQPNARVGSPELSWA